MPTGAEPAQPRPLGAGNTDHEEVRWGGGVLGPRPVPACAGPGGGVAARCRVGAPGRVAEAALERGSDGCAEGNGGRGFRPLAAKGSPSGRCPVRSAASAWKFTRKKTSYCAA